MAGNFKNRLILLLTIVLLPLANAIDPECDDGLAQVAEANSFRIFSPQFAAINIASGEGKFEEALKLINELLEKEPNNKTLHFKKVLTLRKLNRIEEALDAATLSLKVVPEKYHQGFHDIRTALALEHRYKKRALFYAESFNRAMPSLHSLELLISALHLNHNYEKALELTYKISDTDSKVKRSTFLYWRARLALLLDNHKLALKTSQELLEISNLDRYKRLYARTLLSNKDYLAFTKYLDTNPLLANSQNGRLLLADAQFMQGHTEDAIKTLEKLQKEDPTYPIVNLHLLRAYNFVGNFKEARRLLNSIFSATPRPSIAYIAAYVRIFGLDDPMVPLLRKTLSSNTTVKDAEAENWNKVVEESKLLESEWIRRTPTVTKLPPMRQNSLWDGVGIYKPVNSEAADVADAPRSDVEVIKLD